MGNKKGALERVEMIADEVFATHRFEHASVAEIAARARCSTATIYEVYGSKRELYKEFRRRRLEMDVPLPTTVLGLSALESLMLFCIARVSFLYSITSPQNFFWPDDLDWKDVEGCVRDAMRRNNPVPAATLLVAQAQTEGLLRAGDPAAIAYVMCAAVGYDALATRLNLAVDRIDPNPIVEVVFDAFSTRAGAEVARSFIRSLPASRESFKPILLGDVLGSRSQQPS